MSEVTVFMGQWIVTAPAPMTTASKSALSPRTVHGSGGGGRGERRKRREIGRVKEGRTV